MTYCFINLTFSLINRWYFLCSCNDDYTIHILKSLVESQVQSNTVAVSSYVCMWTIDCFFGISSKVFPMYFFLEEIF